jgi:uncharacterized SAM-binding protein YcdF (DUF218 family)
MFFVVSKILSYLLNPLFWILGLLIIALIVRKPGRSKRLVFVSVVLFYLFSNHFLVDEVVRLWEVRMTRTVDLKETYDAGIVPGGNMVDYDAGYDRLIFRYNTDKLFQAIDLYKKGTISRLMIAGGPGDLVLRSRFEAAFIKRYLVSIGIPDSVIFVDSVSDNTHQNAANSAGILKQIAPGGDYLLITSAIHMRRAAGCFRKEGLQVTPYPVSKFTGPRRYDIEYLLVPHLESFVLWKEVMHEMVGYPIYFFMGYL